MSEYEELIARALEAREKAYAPYSNFKVGAVLQCKSGEIYTGCNIESVSFSPSNCAERTAIFKAVSERDMEFESIVIVGGIADKKIEKYCPPCGVCRQVMMEFCDPDYFKIVLAKGINNYTVYLLNELLPLGFGPNNLK